MKTLRSCSLFVLEIQSEVEDRQNHAVDALRYAVEGLRRGGYDTSMKWVETR